MQKRTNDGLKIFSQKSSDFKEQIVYNLIIKS